MGLAETLQGLVIRGIRLKSPNRSSPNNSALGSVCPYVSRLSILRPSSCRLNDHPIGSTELWLAKPPSSSSSSNTNGSPTLSLMDLIKVKRRQAARLSSMALHRSPHSSNAVSIRYVTYQWTHCESTHLTSFTSKRSILCFRDGRQSPFKI